MLKNLKQKAVDWLTDESPPASVPLCDFERMSYEIKPCDVLLVEGRSRVSDVISMITQSPWTHASLYLGRLHDIEDVALKEKIAEYYQADSNEQLVIEGFIGKGTIIAPLNFYKNDHIRICRPRGISRRDTQQVLNYAIEQLGTEYDVRQIVDLARFMFPWSILPRQWRSSLFEHGAGETTRTVCSSMIAEAFASINFPILPLVKQHEETGIELIHRNPRIYTPKDFDYSPYFDIIKYPFIELEHSPTYRTLPWNESLISHDAGGITIRPPKEQGTTQASSENADHKLEGEIPILSQKPADDTPLKDDFSSESLLKTTKKGFFSIF